MADRRKRADKYQFRISKKGHKTIYKTFRTIKAGEIWAREIENDMERNVYSDKRIAERHTFNDLAKFYKDEIAQTKARPDETKAAVDALTDRFGHLTIAMLGYERVLDFATDRLEIVSGETVRKNLNLLKKVIEIGCIKKEIPLTINPVLVAKEHLKIKNIKLTGKSRDRRIADGEYKLISDHKHIKHTNINALFKFAIETCMRRGEISAMKRAHRTSKTTLYIPITKTGVPREIPLSPAAQLILDNLEKTPRLDGFYWGMRPDSITQAFNRITDALHIQDLVFHDTRHEGISRLFEAGWDIPHVAAVSGHADWKSLKRYTNLKASDLAEMMV